MAEKVADNTAILLSRMRMGRLRQRAIAVVSVAVAVLVVASTSPSEIGSFAYYAVTFLLLLNAIFALRQGSLVILPIETLLDRMNSIEARIDANKFEFERLYRDSDNEFACLAAGMDGLIEKLADKARLSTERALVNFAFLRAVPFTLFTVSHKGKVQRIIQDPYKLVPLLGIAAGETPKSERWGGKNWANYLRALERTFDRGDMRWFEMAFGTHRLRGTIKRVNELTALVVLGDMSAIDKIVSDTTGGKVGVNDLTHKQEALRRFAASVAHDAKNIFTALGNILEVERNTTDPQLREHLPMIEDAIIRGTKLMREMMTFSGQTRYSFTCLRADETLREIADNPTIRALIPSRVRVFADIPDGLPYVDADREQIWKIPFNLVKNSTEAMGEADGRIFLKAKPFEMTEEIAASFHRVPDMRMGPGVLITHTDDGPGIPENRLTHLFDPFFSSKGEGRGFGLATVLSIVMAHGGAIRATSEHGRGTTFETWLPVSRNSPEELRMMREIAPNGEVLLVDDDPAILRTTQLVLKALKIAAHPASTEGDALRKLNSLNARIRAVVVDAHLGGVTSAGLLRTIRAQFPKLPVILTSGAGEDAIRADFAGTPYDRFLEKPFSVAELSAALEGVKA